MPTTVALDDDLVGLAQEYTGVAEKTALIREALKALIERESARRLASLGGTMPELKIEEPSTPEDEAELILADTSIWIDHFRSGNKELHQALNRGQIVTLPA